MTEKAKKYRVHDREFKINAAKLVNEQGMTKNQVAKDLGVSPSSPYKKHGKIDFDRSKIRRERLVDGLIVDCPIAA